MWYRIIALFRVIQHHLEEKCTFSNGMLHLLKGSSIVYRGIVHSKKSFSKENCKGMTNASLQAGHPSLLYLILHLEQGYHMLNSCYILHIHTFPSKKGLYFFSRKSCIFEQTRYFARDSGKVNATISMLLRCKYISTFLFLNSVYSL